jgi:hypothetical protein
MASITSLPSGVSGSSLVLISEQTASSSATIDFTSSIDSTYKEYIIKFINAHPATNSTDFQFQVDTGTNTNYNITCTTTAFRAYHGEDGSSGVLEYHASSDQAQGTDFNRISPTVGNGNDESVSGNLTLFDPSNTTFVKHFIMNSNGYHQNDICWTRFGAGYFNTTTAITRVRFKFASGNIDSGTFKLYGVV